VGLQEIFGANYLVNDGILIMVLTWDAREIVN